LDHEAAVHEQQDNLFEADDSDKDVEIKSWPIIVEDIQWCKTNRGNDRVCMAGFTYDYISISLKKKPSLFSLLAKELWLSVNHSHVTKITMILVISKIIDV